MRALFCVITGVVLGFVTACLVPDEEPEAPTPAEVIVTPIPCPPKPKPVPIPDPPAPLPIPTPPEPKPVPPPEPVVPVPVVDERPVMRMFTMPDHGCWICSWWEDRGDADLPYKVVSEVNTDSPYVQMYGWPVFTFKDKQGTSWYAHHVGQNVDGLTGLWRRRSQ